MDPSIVEIITEHGITGGLLLVVLWWLAKHYLPQQQRQHREDLRRILDASHHDTAKLVQAVERNSRIIQFNSQAMLVQSFINGGLAKEDAEQIVRRIQVAIQYWPPGADAGGRNGAG